MTKGKKEGKKEREREIKKERKIGENLEAGIKRRKEWKRTRARARALK